MSGEVKGKPDNDIKIQVIGSVTVTAQPCTGRCDSHEQLF